MTTIPPAPAHTIAVLSQKGGTGKTTLVRSLTHALHRLGMDVLPIDLDPQGNLSDYFGVDRDAFPTVREALVGEARTADAIHNGMIPANLSLAEAELALSGKMGRELALKRALSEARWKHDFILIDCPPALGLLTVNALVAASHVLISAEAEYFSLLGVEQVLELIKPAREWLNEDLQWLGVVVNIADLGTRHARENWTMLRENFGSDLFETVIRKSIRYPESAQQGLSILDYRPEIGDDYICLADELLVRLGEEEGRRPVDAVRRLDDQRQLVSLRRMTVRNGWEESRPREVSLHKDGNQHSWRLEPRQLKARLWVNGKGTDADGRHAHLSQVHD